MKKTLLTSLLIGIIFSVNSYAQSMDASKVSAIETLISQKLIKFDIDLDKAWVSPAIWNSYNIDEKESFTFYCAQYIRHKERSSNKPSIDIYDYKSGKKLAEYSPIWGFSIEDD